MDNLIKTLDLKRYFNVGGGRQLHAVDGINIEISRGKTLGVARRIWLWKIYLGTGHDGTASGNFRTDPV